MKVYELITELSKLPAGSEVEFATLMTVDEFTKCEIVDEIDGKMQSKLQKGLYFAGEVVDVDGLCGGYNLQWAWSSGVVAGKGCVND